MRIGVRIPPCQRVDTLAECARSAEEHGFDQVWFPDSQLLWRDVFTTLTAAALRTERIGLGTAVTNVATRHPAVLASAARSVAELAPGRLALGIGVGNSSVGPIGMRPSRAAELRSGVRMLRSLLAGEEWDFGGGARARLRDPGSGVPIHIAASGPRNLRTAGEIGDGAILLSGVSSATLAAASERVREGAAAAGRPPGEVPVTVSAYCTLTDDVLAEARRLKPVCAAIAQTGGAEALRLAGVEVRVPDWDERIEGVYPDLVHAEDWDAAVHAASAWVGDQAAVRFAEEFCLIGTADRVAGRIRELAESGVSGLLLQHVGSYDLPYELIEALGGDVLPALR